VLRDIKAREEYHEGEYQAWAQYWRDVDEYELYRDKHQREQAEKARKAAKQREREEKERKRQEEEERRKETERQVAERERLVQSWKERLARDEEKAQEIKEYHTYAVKEGTAFLDEEYRCCCAGCIYLRQRASREARFPSPPMTREERIAFLEWKAEEAERRAVEKAREAQDQQAKARLKEEAEKQKKKAATDRKQKAREKVAEVRSREALRRARESQEKGAIIRMANEHIKTKQKEYLSNLSEFGVAEVVLDLGWKKTKGVAKCLFCDDEIKYYSFRCPDGGAIACNPCKNKLSRFTPQAVESDEGADGREQAEVKDNTVDEEEQFLSMLKEFEKSWLMESKFNG
jgi:hypothetical protein